MSPALDSFIATFAPLPPPNLDDQWAKFVLDMIITGATGTLGRLIGGGKRTTPHYYNSRRWIEKQLTVGRFTSFRRLCSP